MSIQQNIKEFKQKLEGTSCQLIAVSKTHPTEAIREAYEAGQRAFGENKVQEMVAKQAELPTTVEWHLIGHLQTNKVRQIGHFVHLIHSVDSLKLLQEINKQALKNDRVIDCLLQIYIAQEETKSGLSIEETKEILESDAFKQMQNVRICGLMGVATFTQDQAQLKKEFSTLRSYFTELKSQFFADQPHFKEISMGMSADYELAIAEGSTMVRVGSAIFGQRNYAV